MNRSKITRITLFSIISIVLFCCNNKDNKDIIPEISIYIDPIYVNDPEFQNLFFNDFGTHIITEEGYEGNGIVIINLGDRNFAAYDCTCTNEVKKGCFVRSNHSNSISVKCNCCESTYELINGTVTEDPAIHPLKSYKTTFNGEYLRVYNN